MDLMCNEKEMFKDHHHHQIDNQMQQMMHIEPQVNTASADPTFLSERCLENLLKSEETHPVLNFYNNPQCEITPKMRRIVAEWMMEVSFLLLFIIFNMKKYISFSVRQILLFKYRTLCNRLAFRDTLSIFYLRMISCQLCRYLFRSFSIFQRTLFQLEILKQFAWYLY